MRHVNALAVRHRLGEVLADLERTGEPVVLEKGRQARAVLISLAAFRERFVDKVASEERDRLVEGILAFQKKKPRPGADRRPAHQILRDIRGPLATPRR